MGIMDFLSKKIKSSRNQKEYVSGDGMLIFESTSEVIRAERILKASGYSIKVMGPPPAFRKGCDLVIVFPVVTQTDIMRFLLKEGIKPLHVFPLSSDLLSPVSLFRVREFGDFVMVRAANMKISFDKGSGLIVNISGGGCPDVPFVASQMIGKTIWSVPSPLEIGYTLCAYALGLALDHARSLCSQ